MSVPESVAAESDDSDSIRDGSGVFRRLMARDLYDLTKRVEELEQTTSSPSVTFLASWAHIATLLIVLLMFVGSILYIGHRVNKVESLQRQEMLAVRSELELAKATVERLRQTIRLHSGSLAATKTGATSVPRVSEAATNTAAIPDTAQIGAPPKTQRAPLPAQLEPGEVLLIVASTLTRDEAMDRARVLELDGHASEVILGVSDYYGVALGRFEFERAKKLKSSIIESGAANTPYLISDESIDSYVYP